MEKTKKASKHGLSKSDTDRFIKEIKKRPVLWDLQNESYKKRENTDSDWKQLSEILNFPVPSLKIQWKALRDKFRRERYKELLSKSSYRSNWRPYSDLMFLKDQIKLKTLDENKGNPKFHQVFVKSEYNLDENTITVNEDHEDDEFSITDYLFQASVDRIEEHGLEENLNITEESNVFTTNNLTDEQLVVQNLTVDSAQKQLTINSSNINNIESIFGLTTNNNNNDHLENYKENYYFLMSLLPHLEQASPAKRLQLRMKLEKLVYEEIYKND